MVLKYKACKLSDFTTKKIKNDIKYATEERANGNYGIPIEEVLLNMKRIVEGEIQ